MTFPLSVRAAFRFTGFLQWGGAQRKATETVFRRVRVNLSLTLSCYPRTPLRLEFCR